MVRQSVLAALCLFVLLIAGTTFVSEAHSHTPADASYSGQRVDLSVTIEVLDAVQAELLASGLCNGGESIDIWLRPAVDRERTLEMVCVVPGVLRIFRMAYVQKDGVVFLADDLSFRDLATRDSLFKLEPDDTLRRPEFPTHVASKIAESFTEQQYTRHLYREERKRRLMWRP